MFISLFFLKEVFVAGGQYYYNDEHVFYVKRSVINVRMF